MFDRGLILTSQAIRRQLAAMPNELYLVRLIHHATRRPFPGERLWTADQLVHTATVRFLRVRNREGCDVYIWPYAADQNAGYILVDLDHVSPATIERMRADGCDPCVLLQTSPGHLQAWVHVSTFPLEPAVATSAGKHLARIYGGDPASTDWRHLGRLAGFTNQKPQRRTFRGYAPWVKIVHTRAGLARSADVLLQSAVRCAPQTIGSKQSAAPAPNAIPSPPTTAAQAAAIYQYWAKRWHIAERFVQPDWSILDLWIARKLLSQGMPATQIQDILRLGSPHFPRCHGDPDDYLRRTLVHAAFPSPGGAPVCNAHARASARAPTISACSNSTGGR